MQTKLTITGIKEEVSGVKTFYFEEIGARDIDYRAGQYLTFIHRHQGQEIRRSYSILSAPALNEPLAITVKRIDNGIFSRYLADHVKMGDELITTGAAGFFTIPENVTELKQLFFFAAGTGIVPIYSVIKEALHRYPHLQLVMSYSNRSLASTLFRTELLALAEESKGRLHIHWLFSDNKDLLQARLSKERVYRILEEHAAFGKSAANYYLCGPFAYMRNTFIAMEEAQVPVDHIKRENFNTERHVSYIQPPDKDAHRVILKQGDHQYSLDVKYPVNILQAAKKQGITISYSCEVGRCGSCAGRCVSGKVWMSNNEVLTENEIEKGIVLTCTGYPVGGNVIIEI